MLSRAHLSDDFHGAWLMAAGFCVLSAIPLLGLGLLSAGQALAGVPPRLSLGSWLVTVLTIWASYFVAGSLGAVVFWLTRPLRSGLVGFILTGIILTPTVYGSVSLVAAIVWQPVGELFFGDSGSTRADFLSEMPGVLAIFAAVGILVGAFFWYQDQ